MKLLLNVQDLVKELKNQKLIKFLNMCDYNFCKIYFITVLYLCIKIFLFSFSLIEAIHLQ